MTIFHCRMVTRTLAALTLLSNSAVGFANEGAAWRFSENQASYELNYGEPETDADVSMRCEESDGWVFMIYHIGKRDDRQMKLSAGTAAIMPSFQVHYDGEVMEGYYVEMAIPAKHKILSALAAGHALRFNRTAHFPVRSDAERREIGKFIAVCEVHEPVEQ